MDGVEGEKEHEAVQDADSAAAEDGGLNYVIDDVDYGVQGDENMGEPKRTHNQSKINIDFEDVIVDDLEKRRVVEVVPINLGLLLVGEAALDLTDGVVDH